MEQMNLSNATMGSDFTNPMVFDQAALRKKIELGEHCPPGVDPEEIKKWKIIYTCYFNSDLTISGGRRVNKEHCVSDPNINMLQMCCD